MSGQSPILISGVGRSGTSILLLALIEHKSVSRPRRVTEAPFLREFIDFLCRLDRGDDYSEYVSKNYLCTDEERKSYFAKMINDVVFKSEQEGNFFPCKTTMVTEKAWEKLLTIFPDARSLYIVRNGIEVVNSSLNFEPFSGAGFTALCQRWAEYSVAFSYLEKSSGASLIYHDKMSSDPYATFRDALDGIGLERDDAPARYVEENFLNSSFEKDGKFSLQERRELAWSSWTGEQRSIFNTICGPEMERHGFSLLAL